MTTKYKILLGFARMMVIRSGYQRLFSQVSLIPGRFFSMV